MDRMSILHQVYPSFIPELVCKIKCWFRCDDYQKSEYKDNKCICTCKGKYGRPWQVPMQYRKEQ